MSDIKEGHKESPPLSFKSIVGSIRIGGTYRNSNSEIVHIVSDTLSEEGMSLFLGSNYKKYLESGVQYRSPTSSDNSPLSHLMWEVELPEENYPSSKESFEDPTPLELKVGKIYRDAGDRFIRINRCEPIASDSSGTIILYLGVEVSSYSLAECFYTDDGYGILSYNDRGRLKPDRLVALVPEVDLNKP